MENINDPCGGLVHIVLASLASQTSNSSSSACWQDYSIIHPEKEGAGRDPASKRQTDFILPYESPSHLPWIGFAPIRAPLAFPSMRLSQAINGCSLG